jgi:predicted AAA+ superfamily ATPase
MTSKKEGHEKIEFSRLLMAPARKSFFLFGPRGVGKSTWLGKRFPSSQIFDLLESGTFNRLLARPQSLSELVSEPKRQLPIIIDEVQKIPALLDEVHRLIEKQNLTFVLTGSSARKLRRQGANLLAGRALTLPMFPLTAKELGSSFDLKEALRWGTLPGRFSEADPSAFLESYVATYLREEVQQEGLTRNLSAFRRFLETATFSQAAPLVVSNVATDANVERKTVEEYFSILDDLMIGARIPVFAKRAKRELLKKSKFFFFDAGVFQALRPKGPLDSPEEVGGLALETLVFNELRALNAYEGHGYEIFFWRTKTKQEVDFVLYGEKGILAIEVKSSDRPRQTDLEGLKLFRQDYPMARALLLYAGNQRSHEAGIDIIPLQDFFANASQWL